MAASGYSFSYSAAVFSLSISRLRKGVRSVGMIGCAACVALRLAPMRPRLEGIYTVTAEIALSRHEARSRLSNMPHAAETGQ